MNFPEYYEFENLWKVAEFFINLTACAPSALFQGCGNMARVDYYKESEAWKVDACARVCGGIKLPPVSERKPGAQR